MIGGAYRLFPLILLLLSACGGGDAPQQQPEPLSRPVPVVRVAADAQPSPQDLAAQQILRRGNGEEPETLDPHRAQGVPANNILRDLFEGLTIELPDGQVAPGTAEHWDISRDGKRYTFYLRDDARWSNGDVVTAEDFVFGLRRSADPATSSPAVQVLSPIVNAHEVFAGTLPADSLGVRALNDHTVQIDLVAPTPYFLSLLTLPPAYPVHRPSLAAHGDQYSRPGNLVSNGAFVLSEWVIYSHILLNRNPFYWDYEKIYLDQVYYYPFADQNAELAHYRAGDLDWTYEVPSSQYDWLEQKLPDELSVTPWLGTYYLGFNLTRAPFEALPELRVALSLAVDRELLVDKVTRFGELPTFHLVPKGIPRYESPEYDYENWTQAEREAEAKRLYQRAGYDEEFPLRIELRYNTSANHKKIALAVAAMWQQVLGVETVLINEEWRVFLQNRQQGRITEVYRGGWIGDYNDPYAFLEIFHSQHRQNDSGYENPTFDRLLERIGTERIPSRRMRLLAESERVLLQDLPLLPLYTYVTKRLVSPRVQGWQPNVMDNHLSRWMYIVRTEDELSQADREANEQARRTTESELVDTVDETVDVLVDKSLDNLGEIAVDTVTKGVQRDPMAGDNPAVSAVDKSMESADEVQIQRAEMDAEVEAEPEPESIAGAAEAQELSPELRPERMEEDR
ncbi:MAG: peptide ABC transporter substrate-binding protein [Xanthomonadales bacterium]|nr:peptide ABC transporter substrate-binding protein [Xanthomonadales bacterium]